MLDIVEIDGKEYVPLDDYKHLIDVIDTVKNNCETYHIRKAKVTIWDVIRKYLKALGYELR